MMETSGMEPVMRIELGSLPTRDTVKLMLILNARGYRTSIDSSEGKTWVVVHN